LYAIQQPGVAGFQFKEVTGSPSGPLPPTTATRLLAARTIPIAATKGTPIRSGLGFAANQLDGGLALTALIAMPQTTITAT
jgi:hypothetical protein